MVEWLESSAPVVQTLDSTIHWIKVYPMDDAIVSLILIRWIVIYPVDSAIQRLNNRGLDLKFGGPAFKSLSDR